MRTIEGAMVDPDRTGEERRDRTHANSFEEGLAYLLLFSEAMLELVPDGIGVLDEQLRVRACNEAFARVFGFDSAQAARGTSMEGDPIFRLPLPDDPGRTVRAALTDKFRQDDAGALALDGVDLRHPLEETTRRWSVRLATWDTEDPAYRRVLLWAHPWQERAADVAPADAEPTESSGAPETPETVDRDAEFSRIALGERLLENAALCVVDPALRVLRTTPRLDEMLASTAGDSQDRHLFARFPALRDDGLTTLLEAARTFGTEGSLRLQLPDGTPVEIEVQPMSAADDAFPETLLLLHEVQGMSTSPSVSEPSGPAPSGVAEILAGVDQWPPTGYDRVAVVDSDSWTRMVWTDALRQAGVDRIAPCDRAGEVMERHDLREFGAVVVGLDHAGEEASRFCALLAREHPDLPVVVMTDGTSEHARALLGPIRVTGILAGNGKEDELGLVVPALMTVPEPSSEPAADSPTEDSSEEADVPRSDEPVDSGDSPARVYDLVVLGAEEADVSVMRLLYRVEQIRIRMVYDPDPSAFGLSLAQNLGIPAISGAVSLSMERSVDVVVTARPGLEEYMAQLGLESAVHVTRDEVELFLVDPDSFLATEREAAAPPEAIDLDAPTEQTPVEAIAIDEVVAEEPPADDSPLPDPFAEWDDEFPESAAGDPDASGSWDGFVLPPSLEATQAEAAAGTAPDPEPEPVVEPEPPAAEAPETPAPAPARAPETPALERPEEPIGPPASDSTEDLLRPIDTESVTREVGALLGALDLLLDFDRLANRVLEMAIETADGHTGSLMLLTEDDRLRIVAGLGLSESVLERTNQRVGDGIAGRIAADGEPLLLLGPVGDERFLHATERREIRSSACVPVTADGRVIGVLNVNSDPETDPFDAATLAAVARLGRQVGIALDRSRQLRSMRGRSFEMSVRAEIEAIASSAGDIVSRLHRIADRIVQILNVDTCAIWLNDHERRRLAMRAVSGLDVASMDAVSVPVGTGHVGRVAQTLRPLVLRSELEDVGEDDPIRLTNVAVPIRFQTDLIGVLSVESSQAMDDERIDLVSNVAGVIGEQIGHSRAFADSEHKVTLLSALGELGVAFASAPEKSTLATLVTFSACTLLESEVAALRLLREGAPRGSEESDHYERVSTHGTTISDGDPLAQLEERILRHVAERHLPCGRSELASPEVESLMQRANIASFLGLPLSAGDEQIGVLTVFRVVDPGGKMFDYGDQDLEIAGRMGDYVGAAAARFIAPGPDEDSSNSDGGNA